MTFFRVAILSLLLVITVAPTWAQEDGPGGIVQLFGCTLQEGQTADNVWALMDALAASTTDRPNADPAWGLFVWVPFRTAAPYDFVFGVISTDLVSMATGSEAYAASAAGQANGLRFAAVVSGCESVISASEQVKAGNFGMTGGDRVRDAVVETFTCDLKGDADMGDVRAAVDFWKQQIEKIDSPAIDAYGAFLLTPIRGGTGADFGWVGNSPDLKTWAEGQMAYLASPGGQAADARFFEISDCVSSLWDGYWIVTPQQF